MKTAREQTLEESEVQGQARALDRREGCCCCGAIRVEISGDSLAQFYCHCRDCQLVHGAAYVPVMLVPPQRIRVVQGEPARWALKRTQRWSCPRCGTRLVAEGNPRAFGVIATLFPLELFRPAFHIYCESAVLPVNDGLPHYRHLPARFGGSDELVHW